MKKALPYTLNILFFGILLFTTEKLSAQYEEETQGTNFGSHSQVMTSAIENLNFEDISSKILADKAYNDILMEEFNGQGDTSVLTLRSWRQIYRQLYVGSIIDSVIPTPESKYELGTAYTRQNKIPIILANIQYHKLKDYAVDSNLITLNSFKFYDVPTRNESPYLEKTFFGATVLKDKIYQDHATFILDTALYISNGSNRLDSIDLIEIDFGDGNGYIDVNFNEEVTINFTTIGTKILTVRITYLNSSVYQTSTYYTIESLNSLTYDADFNVTGYTSYGGVTGTGVAYVLYGCGNNNQLKKPIIVSDGFDALNERHFPEMYAMFNTQNFVQKLLADGYDVVLLDYTEGADYVQRNAFVLISLINNIKAQLVANGSTSKLTVVGPSMAGLVSRYALTYMEINNLNHNTDLFISFDSPNLGANIPLGDQHFFDFFGYHGNIQACLDVMDILTTPAAKQMLVHHIYYTGGYRCNALRNTLINDTYFAYPTNLRKVAIANGSGNNTQFYNACDQLIDWNYPQNNIFKTIIGKVWAVPDGGSCVVFNGKFPILVLNNSIPWGYNTRTVTPSGTSPYDNAPGGYRSTNQQIADGDTQNHGNIQTYTPNHSFIPTVSALALNGAGLHLNVHSLSSYPNINNNSTTPFSAIYTPTSNQDHGLVTSENIAWIMTELGALDLYIQNQTISNTRFYEARNTINFGTNVTTTLPAGNVIINSPAIVDAHAGLEVIVKNEVSFNLGSEAHLYIQVYPCAAQRPALNPVQTDSTLIGPPVTNILPSQKTSKKTVPDPSFVFRNIPNPAFQTTKIEFRDASVGYLELNLYNVFGTHIKTLENVLDGETGIYSAILETDNLIEGTFICTAKVNGIMKSSIKIVVLK